MPLQADHDLRAELYERANTEGTGVLHEELAKVDPVAASRIHSNDARRIIRALEVFRTSGMPISELQKADSGVSGIPSVYYGVRMDREALVARIEARVDQMMNDGLLEELKALIGSGYGGCKVAMQAIGYKELIAFLDGKTGLADAVEKIKIETRKYAKRQMSWFRRNKTIVWFDSGNMSASDIAAAIWDDYLKREVEEG
jgi:tRNA dimethylallyltransferase